MGFFTVLLYLFGGLVGLVIMIKILTSGNRNSGSLADRLNSIKDSFSAACKKFISGKGC